MINNIKDLKNTPLKPRISLEELANFTDGINQILEEANRTQIRNNKLYGYFGVEIEGKYINSESCILLSCIKHRNNMNQSYRSFGKTWLEEEIIDMVEQFPPFQNYQVHFTPDILVKNDMGLLIHGYIKFKNMEIGISKGDITKISGATDCELRLEDVIFKVNDKVKKKGGILEIDTIFLKMENCEFQNLFWLSIKLDSLESNILNPEDIKPANVIIKKCILKETTFYLKIVSKNKAKKECQIILSDNKIGDITIHSEEEYQLMFVDGNEVESLDFGDTYPQILDWGFYEKINLSSDNSSIDSSRRLLNKLKKQAIDEENYALKNIFNYHLTVCDEASIDRAKKSDKNIIDKIATKQDKIIMKLGRWLSNHGTSWIRPIARLAGVNLLIATFALACVIEREHSRTIMENIISTGYLFFELFNPLNTLNDFVKNDLQKKEISILVSAWLSFLTMFNKLAYAICGYEFVRAVRRFTRK